MTARGVPALLAAAALAVGVGCGSSDEGPSTDALRDFDEFTVYWVGSSFDGLDLNPYEDELDRRRGRRAEVSLLYGDCAAEDDTGCALPLEIDSYPACARRPRPPHTGTGNSQPDRFRLRGVPAASFGDNDLELYTADTTIVIFADGDRARMRRAAAALRSVRGGIAAGDRLPAPSRAALASRRRC